MNFDNFTIKSQEAIQKAVEIVRNHNEQSIEPVHLLKGILQVGESLTSYLFQKLGVNAGLLNNQVDREIESLPKVNGGEPYLRAFRIQCFNNLCLFLNRWKRNCKC